MCHLTVLFPLWSTPLLSSSTTLFFFLLYILGIKSFFFFVLTPFSQLHPFFHTLHTPHLLSLLFFLLLLFSSMLLGIDYTICFLLVSQGGILVPDFCRSVSLCFHILYSPHILPLSPLLSILSLAEVCLWGHTLLSTIFLCLFSYGMHWLFLLLHFLWLGHMHYLFFSPFLSFNFSIWTLPLVVPYPPTSKTFYLLYYFLPSYFHFFFYTALHYPTCYHFKFILGNQFPLYLLFLIPTVVSQMSELPITLIFSLSPFF